MSRAALEEHRRIWRAKPALRAVYGVWFDLLLATLPHGSTVLEVGAGPGLLKEHAHRARPDLRWIATDVVEVPWSAAAADAMRLPVRAGSVDAVVGVDFIHHLARPLAFAEEAARALRPGGRLAAVEPWVSPLSYPVYRWAHHEGCTPDLDPTAPFPADGACKDPFAGDAAVLPRMLELMSDRGWAAIGLAPPNRRLLNGFAYLPTLGFRRGTLLPARTAPLLIALDRRAARWARWLAFRCLVVWRRLG